MAELVTAAQMRAIEKAAIDSGAVTGLELMERAGRGVVAAVFEEWPELKATSHRAVVLCGPGNNGGDGFVVARLLKEWGWEVEVFLYGKAEKLPPDARRNYEYWAGMGQVKPWPRADDAPRLPHDPWACDLIVDALFGTGLTRPILFDGAHIGCMLPEWDLRDTPDRPRTVAVDVPSGLCADSGRVFGGGDALWADLTVTFHAAKPGHFLKEAEARCGKIRVVPIGLAAFADAGGGKGVGAALFGPDATRLHLLGTPNPSALRKANGWGGPAHKYSHGHALILSGPPGHGGAARLAARGAIRVGAGVVTLGCPADALLENAARLDAIMLRAVGGADGLGQVLEDARINALCLGPGLGISEETRALVARAVDSGRALVLDADALTLIARDAALFAALHEECVLTPHAGEFARLFPDIAEKLNAPATKGPAYSKVDATRDAAARAGCVVLFKGPDTVIAGPDGRCAINAALYDRAAPWLATAGSGDVLAGFITGLLARGFSPFDAACTGAWLHVEAARSFGPGLIAEDVPEELPKLFRTLGI